MIAYDVEGTAHRYCRWFGNGDSKLCAGSSRTLDLPQLNYLISLFGAEQEIAIILSIRMG
jgi:hypothetical protein